MATKKKILYIIINIRTALYEPFGFSLLLSFLAMFSIFMLMSQYMQTKAGRRYCGKAER